jgi:hypothetical protein
VGKITLSVSTEGYQGSIRKRARVYNNDPKNKQTYLTITAFVKEKEDEELPRSREPLSPEPFSPEPSLPEPTSQVSGQGPSEYDRPPGAEQPRVDESVIPPPVEDPSVSSLPGEESLPPVVDPKQPPPLGEEPIEPEPSLEPDDDSTLPSDSEEHANPKQPN